MKKWTCLVLIIPSICKIALSQDLDYAKKVVSILASPQYKGRGYTGNGDKMAADYIVSQFKELGIKPVDKSYFQNFDISVNTYPETPVLKINKEVLRPAVDYLIESSSPSIDGKFNITIIKREEIANRNILLKKLKESKNGFLFIDSRDKKGEEKEVTKTIDDLIGAIKYDPEVDLKGVIVYSGEKLSWEISQELNSKPIIILNKEIDVSKLKSIQIKITSDYKKQYETQNVIGMIKGQSKPDSFIVVLAHYDHLGMLGPEIYFPGANDNASGVALLLNLGKYYTGHQPAYTMVFIALGAEELGLLGAKEFTSHPQIRLKNVKFLINFDIAGTGDEGIRVVNGSVYKDKFDLMTKINNDNKFLPKIDIRGEACISDHCLFYKKGVPCFYIYTQGGIAAYHDIYDKSETLPLTGFVNYVKLMIKFFDSL